MEDDTTCGAESCIIGESNEDFPQWICCDSCNSWFHVFFFLIIIISVPSTDLL